MHHGAALCSTAAAGEQGGTSTGSVSTCREWARGLDVSGHVCVCGGNYGWVASLGLSAELSPLDDTVSGDRAATHELQAEATKMHTCMAPI